MQVLIPKQAALPPTQEGVQAVQALIPRQEDSLMDSDLDDMQAESPTMLTTTEAEADSPQNPEESPAGNPNARLPLQTRGGVTNYANYHRST